MLKIETDTHVLDLNIDISIDITFENPLFCADKIPVEHSLSFILPATPNNLMALGNPHRINSCTDISAKVFSKIYFGAIVISTGYLIIEHANSREISVQFIGASFPMGIKKNLSKYNFGKIDLGKTDSDEAVWNYNYIMQTASESTSLTCLAPVLHINNATYESSEHSPNDYYSNQREVFINYFNDGYLRYYNDLNNGWLSKIIMSFSVEWLLSTLIGMDAIINTPFANSMKNLVMICSWHPKYQTINKSPVFNVDESSLLASVNFADSMSAIPCNEFISEMLRLTCSSLYIKGMKYVVEQNSDTLDRPCAIDWSRKLIDGYNISREAGCDYIFGFPNDSGGGLAEGENILAVDIIKDMISQVSLVPYDESYCYYVRSTKQLFRRVANHHLSNDTGTHWDFEQVNKTSKKTTASIESDRESFDMTFNGEIATTRVVAEIREDKNYKPEFVTSYNVEISKHCQFYCPTIERVTERPAKFLIGYWAGMQNLYFDNDPAGRSLPFPCVTNAATAPDGTRIADVELSFDDPYGLEQFHLKYKDWIEKDKRVIKGKVLLNQADIHQLDMRNKVNIHGVECFIKSLVVTLRSNSIEPAEVEFVEV